MKTLEVKLLKQNLGSRQAHETRPHRHSKASDAASTGANDAAWNKSYRESFWG